MPMTRLILTMSLPAIFSMTIQAMYNVVDSIFIGNYDADGLTATSLAYPLQMLLIAFAVGTAVGVNSFVSRKLGEKNFVQANDGATHGLVTCIFNYVIFLLLGLFAVRPFMAMYTQNEAILNYGIQYLTVVLCFSFFSIVQIMIEKTLQATGNMIFPMLSQLFGAIVNIIFDPLLIFGIGIFPELGVLGAAIATVFGQFCGMVFCLCILFFKNNEVKVSFKHFKLNGSTLKSIYVVGFPSVIMQSIGSVMIIGLNAILAVSEAAVTVLGIYYKLQSFVFIPCFGLNQGVMPIIGYNYGARKKVRLMETYKFGLFLAMCVMGAGLILFQTVPEFLLGMFNASDEMLRIGVPALRIISICFLPAAFGIMTSTLFQGTGHGMLSLYASLLRQLFGILPLAYILIHIGGVTLSWASFPLAEIIGLTYSALVLRWLYRKEIKSM